MILIVKKKNHELSQKTILYKYGFFYYAYKQNYFFYDVLILLRKLLVLLNVALFADNIKNKKQHFPILIIIMILLISSIL